VASLTIDRVIRLEHCARRFVVRDMVFPDLGDGTETDRLLTLLKKLLKRELTKDIES
jgi:hypothetical protein